MNYSLKKGLLKGIKAIVLIGIPFLITNFPDIANLTIGGLLVMIVNYIKIKTGWKYL